MLVCDEQHCRDNFLPTNGRLSTWLKAVKHRDIKEGAMPMYVFETLLMCQTQHNTITIKKVHVDTSNFAVLPFLKCFLG